MRQEDVPGKSRITQLPEARDPLRTDLLTTVVVLGGLPLVCRSSLAPRPRLWYNVGGSHRLDRLSKRLVRPALA